MTVAKYETKDAFLFTDFGLKTAIRWFGKDVVDALPVYGPRSKHAGKPKGRITWVKCTQGGYVHGKSLHGKGHSAYIEKRRGQTVAKVLSMPVWNEADKFIAAATEGPQTDMVIATMNGNWKQ